MTLRVGSLLVGLPLITMCDREHLINVTGDACRLAFDLGLHRDCAGLESPNDWTELDVEARSMTFWGCFVFDRWGVQQGNGEVKG
jgi:Fungal specific transcription factor domain